MGQTLTKPHLVGVDVGGTFTDVVIRDERSGATEVTKVPSTPEDQSIGFMDGLAEVVADSASVALLIHGTTVATNALIERKGAPCVLVTTRGFRDILEMGRRDRRTVYGLQGEVDPLIPRQRRLEVDERTTAAGGVETPVDPEQVVATVEAALDSCEAVVVSFMNAYANAENERVACEAIQERWPQLYVISAASSLSRRGEFERLSTAAAHAYLQPIVARYLGSLGERVTAAAYDRPPAIIQCNGGVMALEHAIERPGRTVRSGPAAGVIAGAALAREAGFPNAITADTGGTSFDVALVVDGSPQLASEKMIDFRMPLRIATIDVETIGAGGGSIARLDDAGILQVGPESAGSMPGPACYGRGGELPTVTDANVALGRINAARPIGGKRLTLDSNLSAAAIEREVSGPLGISLEAAAEAILRVIDQRMAGQARIMSVGRGYNPADFTLVAFGGGGPVHAAAIMLEVGLARALVPPRPGVTSALGCIEADVQYDFSATVGEPVESLDWDALNARIAAFELQGRELIDSSRIPLEQVDLVVEAEMLFAGQHHTIRVPLSYPVEQAAVERTFHSEYERHYGMILPAPSVLADVHCRVVGRRGHRTIRPERSQGASWEAAVIDHREVFLVGEWRCAAILDRELLGPGANGVGPAIVEQSDTTTAIPPGVVARVDEFGNLILEPVA